MLVRRINLAWKSGHPNQCLRLGDNAKTDRTLRTRFRESASYGSALIVGPLFMLLLGLFLPVSHVVILRKPVRHSKRSSATTLLLVRNGCSGDCLLAKPFGVSAAHHESQRV